MSDYRYLIFDAQYFLTRNFKQLCNYYTEGDPYLVNNEIILDNNGNQIKYYIPKFDHLELSKSFFWSIAKFCREIASCEKVILAWDKYPYHRYNFLKDYKGDRHYATDEDLVGLDPIKDAKTIVNTQFEIDVLKIKQKAKWFIISNFEKLGMKSFVKKGYEADDWANVISEYLFNKEPDIRSAIVSIDSDWKYLIQPNIDYIRPHGEKLRYDEVKNEAKDIYEETGLTLYEYKSIIDSIYGSHNSLCSTLNSKAKGLSNKEIVKSVIKSNELIADQERYENQLKSFSIKDFEDYDMIIKSLYYLDKSGHISDMIEYGAFQGETEFKVTPSYYSNFIAGLNPNLYKD